MSASARSWAASIASRSPWGSPMPMGIGICAKAPKNPETNMASYMWIILMVSGAIIHFAQANSSLEHTSLGQFISAIGGLLIIGGAIVMPIW